MNKFREVQIILMFAMLSLAYTDESNSFLECYECSSKNADCGNRISHQDSNITTVRCPQEHRCTTYTSRKDKSYLRRGCSKDLNLTLIVKNGCVTDGMGFTYCFCDFDRCNAAGISDLRRFQVNKYNSNLVRRSSNGIFASLKTEKASEYSEWDELNTIKAETSVSDLETDNATTTIVMTTDNNSETDLQTLTKSIMNEYEKIEVESTTLVPITLTEVLDQTLTDTKDKINQFINAKKFNANNKREKYQNKISFDYFIDEQQEMDELNAKSKALTKESSNVLLNRIVIIKKIEKILDSMDLEELLDLVESQALAHKLKVAGPTTTKTTIEKTMKKLIEIQQLKDKLTTLTKAESTTTTTTTTTSTDTTTITTTATTISTATTTNMETMPLGFKMLPIDSQESLAEITTEVFDESEPIILTTIADFESTTTASTITSTTSESFKALALETTTESSTTSTSTTTTTTTATEEVPPSTTSVPAVEASFVTQTTEQKPAEASFLSLEFPEVDFNSTDVFKLDQEIIVKTTAKPEATTTPSIQTTEADAFRVSMSSEVLSITEAPADESKQTTTATQVSSTSESKLTVTPSDPIVPFEFLSTITGMGMGLVPVSSTEAILKPTKNTGQKTTTEYDWTHIFSEEYQKELQIDYKCPSNGLFKHPTICWKFIQCIYYGSVHERFLVQNCPAGLYFNEVHQYCDHQYNVKCETETERY